MLRFTPTSVNEVNDIPLIRSPNAVMHESQPLTSDISDVSGSGSVELESVTEGMDMPTDLNPGDITKFWEIESNNHDQITGVQDSLKDTYFFLARCASAQDHIILGDK